ncbi:hypothetical protein [Streptomyces sp. ST2-7A]|uniref:hypothetical protein n=1 Tax=Streptomyces sp. ST2-7A TaxID=2907214 RepID=UPI001F33920A|nr:hypothetical protein [Streptomyces sp. ST2-7A]MCE7079596.1 hypothetical protein [Streptomyces sp. ST2-7A]
MMDPGDYRTAAVGARMRVHAILAAAGLEPDEADELLCALEAGAVADAHCWVEELHGSAPAAQGAAHEEGWDAGVDRALEVLARVADSTYRQHGRARATRSLLGSGEIPHNREQAVQPTAGPGPAPRSKGRSSDRDR